MPLYYLNAFLFSILSLLFVIPANASIMEVILDKQSYSHGESAKIIAIVKPMIISTDFDFMVDGSLESNWTSSKIKFKRFNNFYFGTSDILVGGDDVRNVLRLRLRLENSKKIKELDAIINLLQKEIEYLQSSSNQPTEVTVARIHNLKGKIQVYLDEIQRQSTLIEEIKIDISVQDINSKPLALLLETPATGEAPLEVFFNASGSSDAEGPIAEYCIDFGDSYYSCSSSPFFNHVYMNPGDYAARLKVRDSEGLWSGWDKVIIKVTDPENLPPVLGGNQSFQSSEDNIFNFSLNPATDPEGQTVTYRMTVPPESGVLSNCLNDTGNTECTYTPTNDFNGEVQIGYKAFDDELESVNQGFITILVTPVNDQPVAGDDQAFETTAGVSFDFAVNEATDIDTSSENLTYQIVTAPQYGSLIDCLEQNSDLTCTYSPAPGFVGQDNIVYTVSDGSGSVESQGKISITVHPAPGTPIKQISTGGNFTCLLYETGKVRCWGGNSQGQLGLGHTIMIGDNESPAGEFTSVSFEEEVIQLASGVSWSCALLADGNVRCWGFNSRGQLGLGHTNNLGDNELPSDVATVNMGGGRKAKFVTAGFFHACVILTTGDVKCWGFNHVGQLGIGNIEDLGDNESPSMGPDVQLGEEAVSLAAGHSFTCALLISGKVKCWGHNYSGVIGLGRLDTIGDNEPASDSPLIDLGDNAVTISAGLDHVCALLDSGQVKCWGDNQKGQLGLRHKLNMGDNETLENLPAINLGANAVSISTGQSHTCALLETEELKCWGDNSSGQLGQGHMDILGDNEHPFEIPAISLGGTVSNMSSGSMNGHICVFLDNGYLRCWGENSTGQLGLGIPIDNVGDNELPTDVLPIQHE